MPLLRKRGQEGFVLIQQKTPSAQSWGRRSFLCAGSRQRGRGTCVSLVGENYFLPRLVTTPRTRIAAIASRKMAPGSIGLASFNSHNFDLVISFLNGIFILYYSVFFQKYNRYSLQFFNIIFVQYYKSKVIRSIYIFIALFLTIFFSEYIGFRRRLNFRSFCFFILS